MAAALLRTALLICLCGSVAHGQAPPGDTPAGRTLTAMLGALNSRDRAVVADYIARYGRGESVDDVLRQAQQIGRLELVEIVASQPLRLAFIVESAAGVRLLGMLEVENAEPARVTYSLQWTPVPPGTAVVGFDVDAPTRERVVTTLAARLRELYVLPEPAAEMAESLLTRLRAGGYDGFSDGWRLANELGEQVRRISADQHLVVGFSPVAAGPPLPTPGIARPRPLNPADCGFESAAMLDGAIGYIRIDELAEPVRCAGKATDVLRSIAGAQAVIFDLRAAFGGNAGMAMLLYAQLFESPARVSGVQARGAAHIQEFHWAERVEGVALTATPVYVLTSAETFSAAEAFAYDLQALQRATIVGATTKGGAHTPQLERIDERFVASIPRARVVSPITGANWEGVGVRPDVAVTAGEALATALRLAREAIRR
jgi:hypothetical protein